MNTREPQYFTPSNLDALNQTPASINDQTPSPNDIYAGIKLESLPIKGLTSFTLGALVLLTIYGCWQFIQVYHQAMSIHWSLAAAFTGLVVFVLLAGGRTLWQFMRGKRSLKKLNQLRSQANRLNDSLDLGNAPNFIQQLQRHYQGTPQADLLTGSLNTLPDYSNDGEAITHLENTFLAPLDEEAARRVSAFSLQTAVGVALSPWITLDMALALWRNTRMIDEVAQVYGIRPSFATRLRLIKKVGQQLVFVGATEAAINQYYDKMSLDILGGVIAARSLQGLGAGIYTIRIGIAAMNVCRPIEFNQDNKPSFSKIAAGMVEQAKNILGKKGE